MAGPDRSCSPCAPSGAGITTLAQVAKLSEADVLAMHGVGPKAVRLLAEALDATGRSFAR